MTRREEIEQQASLSVFPWDDVREQSKFEDGFIEEAKWADKTMIEKACRCYCDDICDRSRCGMCYHKYDGNYQVINTFKYNECNELKLIRKAMEE